MEALKQAGYTIVGLVGCVVGFVVFGMAYVLACGLIGALYDVVVRALS